MDNLYTIIGERIREKRIEQNVNQLELAEKVEINRSSISNIEKGRHQPPLHLIYRISMALEIDMKYLLPTLDELKDDSKNIDDSSIYNIIYKTNNISDKAKSRIEDIYNNLD